MKPGLLDNNYDTPWKWWLYPRLFISAGVIVCIGSWWFVWQVFKFAVHLAQQ